MHDATHVVVGLGILRIDDKVSEPAELAIVSWG